MKKYEKLLIVPLVIIIVSVYLIGVNLYNRIDKVDNISDAIPEYQEKIEIENEKPIIKVNINTASHEELCTVNGIGNATASRIIEKRNEVGSFTDIDQLLEIEGIGQKTLDNIKAYITIQ